MDIFRSGAFTNFVSASVRFAVVLPPRSDQNEFALIVRVPVKRHRTGLET